MKIFFNAVLDQIDPKAGPDSYDPAKDPVVVFTSAGPIRMCIADPEMVHDLYNTKKNELLDKTGVLEAIFARFMGHSFLFSKADTAWKSKRKACSHAFYKDRLELQTEIFKDKLQETCEKWASQA